MSVCKGDNSLDTIRQVVRRLAGYDFVKKIFVTGSRTNMRPNKVREDSDWDFIVVVDRNVRIGKMHNICVDFLVMEEQKYEKYKDVINYKIEVYPEDKFGLFKDMPSK